jgi:hypothetical protein
VGSEKTNQSSGRGSLPTGHFGKKKPITILKGKNIPNMNRILVGKPEGKRPLGRPRRRWVDNIKMDLREV